MDPRTDAILKERNFDLQESIIISSETRSGSTWLMELLYSITNSFINWEPLHPQFGIVPETYKWGDRPFLPEDDNNEAFLALMQQTLTMKTYSRWTLKYSTPDDAASADTVLTKFVRANLLLPWMVKNMEFHHKPIYLLRHPIPVALSQFRAFHDQKTALKEGFEVPDWLNSERFITEFNFISGLKTLLEKKVALWCLNNMQTINHPHNGKMWLNVYYEDLVAQPEKEFRRILDELQLNVSDELFNTVDFRMASVTDFKGDFKEDSSGQLNKWKNNFTETQLQDIQNIFDHFNLKIYSAFEALPQRKEKQALTIGKDGIRSSS